MSDNSPVSLIELPLFSDARGLMTYFEGENQIPFSIKSAYWIAATQLDAIVHEDNTEGNRKLVIALSGALKIKVTAYEQVQYFELRRPNQALLLEKEAKIEMYDISHNGLCLVLSSHD